MNVIAKVLNGVGVAIVFLGFAIMFIFDPELRKSVKDMWEVEDEIGSDSLL